MFIIRYSLFIIRFSGGKHVDVENYTIERKPNGVLLVHVHSCDADGQPLPDAVFTFRPNDPQYEIWSRRLAERNDLSGNS